MTHIYDRQAAGRLVQVILKEYIPAFAKLKKDIMEYYGGNIPEV